MQDKAKYSTDEREVLLNLAKESVDYGIKHRSPMLIEGREFPDKLIEQAACFVTLNLNKHLRGCIGSLLAHRPLVADVVHNSFAAAFGDPRFTAVTSKDVARLEFHISVLSAPTKIEFTSQENLLEQIRPGIDGLILSDVGRRGTFLPSVWEQLPEKEVFLSHLKQKAGFSENYWSETIQVERYITESFC